MPSQTTALPTFTVRCPSVLYEAVQRIAKRDGQSAETWIRQALEGIVRAEAERLRGKA